MSKQETAGVQWPGKGSLRPIAVGAAEEAIKAYATEKDITQAEARDRLVLAGWNKLVATSKYDRNKAK